MKRLFFITLLLVSFVLFSCKNDLSSDAQGSISFDTGSTADYISRSASQNIIALNASNNSHNENEYISYTIKISISTEGDYEEKVEKEYSKLLKDILNTTDQNQAIVSFIKDSLSKPISINKIPVGSSVKVVLKIQNIVSFDKDGFKKSLAGNQLPQDFINSITDSLSKEAVAQTKTWNGESETFVVRRGENKVNIKLKGLKLSDYEYGDNEEGTNIILYNPNALYSFSPNLLTTKRLLSPELYQLEDGFEDFVIDKNNNVYYAYEDGESDQVLYIYKGKDKLSQVDMTDLSFGGLYLEQNTGILFYSTFHVPDLVFYAVGPDNGIDSYPLNDNIFEYYNDFAISLGEPTEIENGIKYEGFLYISFIRTYDFHILMNRYPITYSIINNAGSLQIDEEHEEDIDFSDFNYETDYFPTFLDTVSDSSRISDMIVQGNNLYALFRDVTISPNFNDFAGHMKVEVYNGVPSPVKTPRYSSRGAIFRINTNNFPTKPNLICETEILSPQTISIPFDLRYKASFNDENFTTTSGTLNFNVIQSKTTLFGPEKFIAIKPKKLVIADDGYFFYKDDNDNLHFKNINTIIEIEEDTLIHNTIGLKTSIPVYYDEEKDSNIELDCLPGTGVTDVDSSITCIKTN